MRNIDELNVIPKENISIDTYFDKMDITKEQKEERQKTAEDLWWVLLLFFAMFRGSIEDGDLDYDILLAWFLDAYTAVVTQYMRQNEYMEEYLRTVPQNIMDTTWKHADYANPDDYWTSEERAVAIAVNEANSIQNYEDFLTAIEEGKTHKTWIAEIDRKTRDEHRDMNGVTIPIEEYFQFSDCEMLVPHDEVNGTARQCSNCRCSIKYKPESGTQDNAVAESGAFGKMKLQEGKETISTIDSRRTSEMGKPNAIVSLGTELSARQQRLLDALKEFDSRVVVMKSDVKMTDLSALTAKTGCEFAMFTRGKFRLIIRGDRYHIDIDKNRASMLHNMGYKWSGHTHPGTDYSFCSASDGDRLILKAFEQDRSAIYNSKGQFEIFGD